MSPPELTELSSFGLLSREEVCKRRMVEPENSSGENSVLASSAVYLMKRVSRN
jgi:hypothetical protein